MTMRLSNYMAVADESKLRSRVEYFFKKPKSRVKEKRQHSIDMPTQPISGLDVETPTTDVSSFLDFVSSAAPFGDVYLFGGILRDLALVGKRGFSSDIDLVVEGEWSDLVSHIERMGARRNKFGGYRLTVNDWPIDIWRAEDTWAIKKGLVKYSGVYSLTDTTVLNWDAILMNWKTKSFVYRSNYFEDLNSRSLDIVLEENPNPLGMAVRVLRHILLKNAKRISPSAAAYLASCVNIYSLEQLKNAEYNSYGDSQIHLTIYSFFKDIDKYSKVYIDSQIRLSQEHLVDAVA